MKDEEAFTAAIAANPEEDTPRLVFADWLDEQELSGGEYLRAEVALFRATGDDVAKARKDFFKAHKRTNRHQRERFEQPDILRTTPTPFPIGWYGVGLAKYRKAGRGGRYKRFPYQSLPNLLAEPLAKDWAWLPPDEEAEDKQQDRDQLNGVKRITKWAKSHEVVVPAEFQTLVGDSTKRWAVSADAAERELDATMTSSKGYMKIGDGWAIPFMFDMFYGDFENQLTWSLYLVPKTAYHCIVVSEPQDDEEANNNEHLANPEATYWCAPSLRAFIYRWWMETYLNDRLPSKKTAANLTPEEQAYLKHYGSTAS
ncbi:MAG: TIGR02996 domain-containing protein [Planctomycetia bacterium]|nr:TIGR02996 domain-containing protein [Planctomycetia bacterium]